MWEYSEESFIYDSNGKIASRTIRYPQQKRESTCHYSYDDKENLIEERSDASENTDNRLYLTTYTYGYIYTPDAKWEREFEKVHFGQQKPEKMR